VTTADLDGGTETALITKPPTQPAWREVLDVAPHCARLGAVFGRTRFVAELPATLVLERRPTDDAGVVKVRVGGVHVGYLAPEDYLAYRPRIESLGLQEFTARATAQIRYDWDAAAVEPRVSVRVRLPG
jgi:hypothetical protein